MNIDLTKDSLLNIFLIGIGILASFIFLFAPHLISIFYSFEGYYISFLLGIILMPFLRFSKVIFYISETASIIASVEFIISKHITNPKIIHKTSRPIYDLFLREVVNSDALIKRIHDLDLQSRFIYSISRLFLLNAYMILLAYLSKIIFEVCKYSYASNIFSILPPGLWYRLAIVITTSAFFFYLSYVFKNSSKSTLIRLRNFEKVAIVNHKEFFEEIAKKISSNEELIDQMIDKKFDKIPHAIIQP